MIKNINIKFEKAIRILSQFLPISNEDSRKPILFHDIRVGVYLYENGYSEDVVLAGVLHDAIEFSKITLKMIESNFGSNVAKLVSANTKDDSIVDKQGQTDELIKRCVQNGQDALIIKAADIIDSFKFYSNVGGQIQLEYCKRNANAILKYKLSGFNDKIFFELKKWLE